MFRVRHLITIPVSLFSFVYTLFAVGKLIWFLSAPNKIKKEYTWLLNILDNPSRFEATLLPVTVDTLLVVLFIFQHSLMRSNFFKSIWNSIGLATVERSIYNIATSSTLLVGLPVLKEMGRFGAVLNKSHFASFPVFDWKLGNRSSLHFVERWFGAKCVHLLGVRHYAYIRLECRLWRLCSVWFARIAGHWSSLQWYQRVFTPTGI